ncbi:MAG: hypothetical protein FD131_1269 [Rhodocyclaceae bacterium]|nr:MAG: hypothetical protein FD131_1269 [Rhodocyclaceae bacterium]
MKTLLPDNHFWHDSLILSVSINTEADKIEMLVLLPDEAGSEQTIAFKNAYGYKEFEGPFQGSPVILSVSAAEQNEQWSKVTIETNAGYRELFCSEISASGGAHNAG